MYGNKYSVVIEVVDLKYYGEVDVLNNNMYCKLCWSFYSYYEKLNIAYKCL